MSAFIEKAMVSPYRELLSLERLYAEKGMTLKKVADHTVLKGLLPTEALHEIEGMIPDESINARVKRLVDSKLGGFSLVINSTPSWPEKLRDSARPTPILYYRGDLGLIEAKSVSVVGSRKASEEGKARAHRISKELTEAGIVIATGLAKGIDTEAAKTAISSGGHVIGVIGTPIDIAYPKENKQLQEFISEKHLLVSQVPFFQYSQEPFQMHRIHFPERNELMAAISDATVIVEASDTSGTLSQARACLHQRRPLFIMRSLLDNPDITWPKKFLKKDGVHVLESTRQVLVAIGVHHAA